jgi:hypothetical protein
MMNIKAHPQQEIYRIQIFSKQIIKQFLTFSSTFKISNLIKVLWVSLLQEEVHGLTEEELKEIIINPLTIVHR